MSLSNSQPHIIHRKRGPRQSWLDAISKLPSTIVADVCDQAKIIDPSVRTYTPGVPLCGFALTVFCAFSDNLMLHKAISMARRDDVIVVEMDSGSHQDGPATALAGDVLIYGAMKRGASGLVLDALIRDVEGIAELGFPVYARGVSLRGPSKSKVGAINYDVHVGGVVISPGDLIIGDRDGLVCLPAEDAESILEPAAAKLEREEFWRAEIDSGRTTFDILGLASKLEGLGIREAEQE